MDEDYLLLKYLQEDHLVFLFLLSPWSW